jgi:hypothetical protein
MGLLPSFFVKINKYKRFTYNPRYYDERKEHREELIKQLEEEDNMRKEGATANYRPTISRGYLGSYRRQIRRKENPTSSIRFIVILILLAAIFYWLLR